MSLDQDNKTQEELENETLGRIAQILILLAKRLASEQEKESTQDSKTSEQKSSK